MSELPDEAPPELRPLSKTVWVLAYLCSATVLPFLCLRRSRAIGNLECVLGCMAGLIVHPGIIPILARTDGDPLQIFVILSAGMGTYLMVLWQYLAGRKAGLWSPAALKEWRRAGIFFAAFLAFALGLGLAITKVRIDAKATRPPVAVPMGESPQ